MCYIYIAFLCLCYNNVLFIQCSMYVAYIFNTKHGQIQDFLKGVRIFKERCLACRLRDFVFLNTKIIHNAKIWAYVCMFKELSNQDSAYIE